MHPLFKTRGVPGTHDVALGVAAIRGLTSSHAGEMTRLPRFDKPRDQPVPTDLEATVDGPVDVVIFEGWCVGAAPEAAPALGVPLNAYERHEDPDGRWRSHVNGALTGPYRMLSG